MRQLFIIGAKLLSIMLIFWTFSAFLAQTQVLGYMSRTHLVALIFLTSLEIILALFLLFGTNMVASSLKIPDTPAKKIHIPDALQVGITLIGVLIAGSSLGYVISEVLRSIFTPQGATVSFMLGEIFKTIIGTGLIIFAKQITKQIQLLQDSSDKPLPKPYVIDEN